GVLGEAAASAEATRVDSAVVVPEFLEPPNRPPNSRLASEGCDAQLLSATAPVVSGAPFAGGKTTCRCPSLSTVRLEFSLWERETFFETPSLPVLIWHTAT